MNEQLFLQDDLKPFGYVPERGIAGPFLTDFHSSCAGLLPQQ